MRTRSFRRPAPSRSCTRWCTRRASSLWTDSRTRARARIWTWATRAATGDTLVVETTNFRHRSVYLNANPDRLKLTERFTRVGPRTVRWEVTVADPTTRTKPWTFAMPLTEDESQPFMPYECHEGNYGIRNILS